MTAQGWIVAVLSFAVAFVLGFAVCTLIRRRKEKNDQRKIEDAEQEALRIVNEAIKSSENKKRETIRPVQNETEVFPVTAEQIDGDREELPE